MFCTILTCGPCSRVEEAHRGKQTEVDRHQLLQNLLDKGRSWIFLSDTGIPGPICGPGCLKLSANLIDVSLSYEDTNSLQTDDFNRTTIGIVAMQVAQPGDQTCN